MLGLWGSISIIWHSLFRLYLPFFKVKGGDLRRCTRPCTPQSTENSTLSSGSSPRARRGQLSNYPYLPSTPICVLPREPRGEKHSHTKHVFLDSALLLPSIFLYNHILINEDCCLQPDRNRNRLAWNDIFSLLHFLLLVLESFISVTDRQGCVCRHIFMAATCSLPLRSTAQLWEAGVHRSPARDTLTTLQSRGGERHGNNTTVGGTSSSDILRGRAQHNQLPADERRGMEGASALGPVGLRDSHQNESSSKLAGPSSHGDPTPILKRSYSTPAVRSMAQDLSTAAGEKKRNRLGYHRTSIACSKLLSVLLGGSRSVWVERCPS